MASNGGHFFDLYIDPYTKRVIPGEILLCVKL